MVVDEVSPGKSDFICGICSGDFQHNKPRQLICLHVFCHNCLQRCISQEQRGKTFLCPTCEEEMLLRVPEAASFPLFYDPRYGKLLRDKDTELSRTHTIQTYLWLVQDFCYLKTGDLIVVDRLHGVNVYDNEGKIKSHYISIQMKQKGPQGVCTDSKSGTVCLTCDDNKSGKGYLYMYKPEGDAWSEERFDICSEPRYIALTNDKHLVITDNKRNLFKYDSQGCEEWGVLMSGKATCVCVNRNNTIIVCVSKDVCLYSADGEPLSSFASDGIWLKPCSVCLDANGDILIADEKSNSLILFDCEKKRLKTIPTLEKQFWRVNIEKSKLVVVGYDNNLSVYKIQ